LRAGLFFLGQGATPKPERFRLKVSAPFGGLG
jgi:hypothetical protein